MKPLSRYLAALVWIASCYGPPCYGQSASRYTITTIAGTGATGFSGDGGAPLAAQLASPCNLAVDGSGALYIADQFNARIRKIPQGQAISTIAGSDTKGYEGDSGQATSAKFASATGVAVDSSGNVYISDAGNHVIRKVAPGGVITTFAGKQDPGAGYAGDGGPATDAQMNTPMGLAVDSAGNLYIAEITGHRVRKVSTSGTITTVAGAGSPGFSGDGGAATSAHLNMPFGVAVDAAGNLYIGDSGNHRVRMVSPNGIITTVAGTGARGYSGDLGLATNSQLNYPSGVAVDSAGNLYIVDNTNSRVRRVSPNGTILTIAGNGRHAYGGDGGLATTASLFYPTGITLDAAGNIYVTDNQTHVIRMLSPLADSGVLPRIGGVISAGAFGASRTVVPGSWIEIYGSDLAPTTRAWAASDFINQISPTLLGGTSVTIGGQQAFVSYVSGGQVNALVPSTVAGGEQQITVSTIAGVSEPYNVSVDSSAPSLYAPPNFNLGRQYAGAVIAGSAAFAIPAGSVAGIESRPVRPGETITLYGVGFGNVLPNVPTGQIARQNTSIMGSLQIFFGETQASITYAGLSQGSVGLYQFNVTVPNGIVGEAVPLSFTFNGVRGAQTLYTAVGN